MDKLLQIWYSSGVYQVQPGQVIMMAVGLLLLYLAIKRNFEPLLLIPIGFGGLLANIPGAGLADPGGILYMFYSVGIETGAFPLCLFSTSDAAYAEAM